MMHPVQSMVLAQVRYETFGRAAARLDDRAVLPFHEIDGEVRLIDRTGQSSHVSWIDYGDDYEVAVRDRSFFNSPPPLVRDMSRSPLWERLIGRRVDLLSTAKPVKHLMIRSAAHRIYCCCLENGTRGVDVLHIARTPPSAGAA